MPVHFSFFEKQVLLLDFKSVGLDLGGSLANQPSSGQNVIAKKSKNPFSLFLSNLSVGRVHNS